jgi:antitoxin component YwqK of YwqJK toxin-antitoxin module/Tfp pilus assembly protein PilF
MKKYQLLLCFLFPLIVAGQQIDVKKFEQKNGLTYEVGNDKPFTGQAIVYYDNGKKQRSTEYKDGKISGKIEGWYSSGNKQLEGQLVNGQKTGVWTAWYENGNKIRQGAFENDKEEGEYIWWFVNGKINKKGIYHAGVCDGNWEWYYENGQIKQEGILRGETNDGNWKEWHENGKQKMFGAFKNGVKDGEWTWWDEKGNITSKKKYKDGQLMEGTDDIDSYIEKMEYALNQKDFKSALSNIERAIRTIEDKSEGNKVYMGLAVYHSLVYSMFQHIDEAETILLKATGIPDNDVAAIVTTNYPPATNELNALVKTISKYPDIKTKVAPHIALAYLYNIIRDSTNMNVEQQLMMERSGYSDWVIQISLALYKIRGLKENTYGEIQFIKEKVSKEGETRENQLLLASKLLTIGQFKEAGLISDKYLVKNNKDIDFLLIKFTIEMAMGNLEKMEDYKKKILAINPKAFDK